MSIQIRKAAVLGAGVMGASIAAHIVGAGIPVYLLDIVPKELSDEEQKKGLTKESKAFRNRFAQAGKEKVCKPSFRAIYDKSLGDMITVGNFEADLEKLSECDWIIEVIVENLVVKQNLFKTMLPHLRPNAIVTTNTSGISVNAIAQELPLELRRRFLGTHFFNPPRYMKLFEIIPGADTAPEYLDFMDSFGTKVLGKGVVLAKDTPNFIANRIGTHATIAVLQLTEQYGYSLSKADLLTGEALARPRSASFRTCDMVGLDIVAHVAGNVLSTVQDAQEAAQYTVPEYVQTLIRENKLGDKTGGGFYKKEKSASGTQKLVWDYKQGQYVPAGSEDVAAVKEAMKQSSPGARIKALVWGEAEENRFAWEAVKATLLYSASKVPEIADDPREIDNAMKWGFNWELGPFEVWEAIGFQEASKRMKDEGAQLPEWVEEKLRANAATLYGEKQSAAMFLSLTDAGILKENKGAVLRDIGDGVACLEFRTKGNTITDEVIAMLYEAVQTVEEGDYAALVLGNQSKNFSAGANLMQIGQLAQAGEWDALDALIHKFQYANQAIKLCTKPVVAAPHGMTLGGGAEIAMHASRQVAHAETYMGLVELGVGLVPGGGGCKELLWRAMEGNASASTLERVSTVRKVWEYIAMAKVSASAHDARKLGYLGACDPICMHPDAQIQAAKEEALALSKVAFRCRIPTEIKATGRTGYAALQMILNTMRDGGFVSAYDAFLAGKVAKILTGGDVPDGTLISEARMLELEREVFLSLCGEQKTQDRIRHMLTKGKPLRN